MEVGYDRALCTGNTVAEYLLQQIPHDAQPEGMFPFRCPAQYISGLHDQFIVLKFVTDGSVEKDISECSFSMNKTEYRLNYHLQRVKDKAMAVHGLNYSFVGVKSLCIRSKPQNPFSMLQVVEYVKQWMMNTSGQFSRPFIPQHTVVIPEWRSIKNQSNGHFYYDPTFTALTCVK